MRQTSLAMKFMMAVLVLGVSTYLAVYIFRSWSRELITTPAYEATIDLGVSASGTIVREETVVYGGGGFVDLSPSQGERVACGETVAVIYNDPSGLDTSAAIRTLSAEIGQLAYVLSSGVEDMDTAKLDANVLQSIVSLRALSSAEDLSSLEETALDLRTMVFQRDFAYGGDSAATTAIIARKQEELSRLQASLSKVATTVKAPVSGVFSGEVDGLESVLTPDTAPSLTPEALEDLLHRQTRSEDGAVGKLITSSTWYLALLMDAEDIRGLTVDRRYPITFSHDWFGTVDMTLEKIGDKQDGRVVCLFSADTKLSETALLRTQQVDVVTGVLSGIRVPRQALRVDTSTSVDEETGQTVEKRQTGVFTVVGTRAEFQKVNVLYTEADFYLVEPVDPGASKRLRAGDDVILNTAGIFNGKVVR